MDTNNEILDAIEILADKKISENITKVLTGICKSVNINNNTCVMDSNGVIGTVQFYGNPPDVNELYRIFVPSNNMSRSFIVVPPKFTVNPNLLDNWYFGRPVNQRGKTEYNSFGYALDRWRINGSPTVIVNNEYITIAGASSTMWLSQFIEKPIAGNYTFSALVRRTGGDKRGAISIRTTGNTTVLKKVNYPTTSDFSLLSVTVFANPASYDGTLSVSFSCYAGESVDIFASKLELGTQQTLAHLENGNWVLNEIPKYEDVLSNCQRYAFNVVNSDDNYEILGGGFAMNTSQFFCFIPTPVTLRGKPTVKYSGSFRAVRNTSAADGIVINSISVDHASNNGVSVVCVDATSSFEVGEYYTLWCIPAEETNSLIFSADL